MITKLTDMPLPAASACAPAKPLEIKPVDPKFASFGRMESHPPAASVLYNVIASMTLAHSTGIPV
jgi:hypothetical protein